MLGVASYNIVTVALGSTIGAIEATPKIWDIAAVWVILKAIGAIWISLEKSLEKSSELSPDIFPLQSGKDYSQQNFPTLVVSHSQLVDVAKAMLGET